MYKVVLASLIILGGFLAAQTLFAAADNSAPGEKVQETLVEVGNTICPVSGEKVGEMGEVVKHAYNGRIYNLCCSMCAKDFDKNPEEFVKIAEDEVAAAAKAGS